MCHPFVDGELAGLIELHRLHARILNRMALPTDHEIHLESVLRVRLFSYTNPELAFFVTDRPVDPERIAEVGVTTLVEGPCEAYSGLNRRELSVPWDLRNHDARSEERELVSRVYVSLPKTSSPLILQDFRSGGRRFMTR